MLPGVQESLFQCLGFFVLWLETGFKNPNPGPKLGDLGILALQLLIGGLG